MFQTAQTGLPHDFYQHEARLTGLAPSSAYAYDVFTGGHDLSLRFVAFGDSGVGSSAQRQLASQMAADSFDVALHAGDVAYGTADGIGGGRDAQFDDWVFGVYGSWLGSRSFFPSIGNHDNEVHSAQPYRDVFVLPENGASST